MPDISDIAPDFTLPIAGGGEIQLSKLRGAPVIVFFYPRDNTAGCTREAQDFTSLASDFDKIGARIVGISKDSVAMHDKFREKHALNILLASDEKDSTCEDYGVWVEKKMYGKTFMGIERTTFLVDSDGRIVKIWRKVKVPGHASEVLDAARALTDAK